MPSKAQQLAANPPETNFDLLPELIGYHLRLAQIATFRDFAEVLGDRDITPSLFGTLVVIDANRGLKQSDLARAIQLDRSTVVTVIDKLEKRGLVARRRAPGDRRSNALELTATGRRRLVALKDKVRSHEARLRQGFSESEQRELVRLLGKVFPDRR